MLTPEEFMVAWVAMALGVERSAVEMRVEPTTHGEQRPTWQLVAIVRARVSLHAPPVRVPCEIRPVLT